jgi:hypothetical protein
MLLLLFSGSEDIAKVASNSVYIDICPISLAQLPETSKSCFATANSSAFSPYLTGKQT